MSTSVGASAPYVPYFNIQPQWVSMSHAQFEPMCLRAVGGLPDSPYAVRKAPHYPNVFTFGRCAIGVYLSSPPATNQPPKPTSWRALRKFALQAVSSLGTFDDELKDGSTHGVSINVPAGMQIAVYEKPFIDPQNKCGVPTTYRANPSLNLEECLRQRAIEKGLLPPDPVAATVYNDDWDLSPEELSQQVNEYIRSLRGTQSSSVQSIEQSIDDLSESLMAQIATEPTPFAPPSPEISPPRLRPPLPVPIATAALSPPTPVLLPPNPTDTKASSKKKKKKKSSPRSTTSLATPTGPVDFAGTPLDVNVLRTEWTRHGKLTPALCNRALQLFNRIYTPEDLRGNHIAFTIPEFFVTSPCAVGVYLTYPDQDGLDTVVKENWNNIEKRARLLALDVTNKGGAGGYVDLKSGVQIVIFDKALMDPSATLQDSPEIPLAYALDQRIYAKQHGGTTIPWTPKWHPTASPTYPTIQMTSVSRGTLNSTAFAPLEEGGVFVGLLDSWVSHHALSYTDCLGAVRILAGYERALEKPSLTLSQPIIISCSTCAIGIFVTNPSSAPHPAINVINTENHDVLRYAGSLVEIAVHRFHIGGFVDLSNGMQIAVWEKTWADPVGVCGRIMRVSLQDCLDQMAEYYGRMRNHAQKFDRLMAAGIPPQSTAVMAAANDLQSGASAVIDKLLGQGYRGVMTTATIPFDWANPTVNMSPVPPTTTSPAALPGSGGNSSTSPSTGLPSENPLKSIMADTIKTALAGFWGAVSNQSVPVPLAVQGSGGSGEGSSSGPGERLDPLHLGGVVLPGVAEPLGPRPPRFSAMGIGNTYSSPRITKGIIVGEGAWVNQRAFLTPTGPLLAGTTGRVVMVGGTLNEDEDL